jgi:hypothetical protein
MRSCLLCLVLCGVGQVSLAETTPLQDPCDAILSACKEAGYTAGGGARGKGLWKNCVEPIMQGQPPANSEQAFPSIDPGTIDACHQERPKFGMPNNMPANMSGNVPHNPVASESSKPSLAFSVSGDQTLNYPRAQFQAFPDEHQSFLRMPKREQSSEPSGYYLVAAMINNANGKRNGWTFLLQTDDLLNFSLVPGAGDPEHGGALFWPAHEMLNGPTSCNYSGITHYDENYAAPGSVLQDPTQPPGNLIMIYESEIHCPFSKGGGATGWVSVGVARGQRQVDLRGRARILWPRPVAAPGYENNWLDYGNGRYAGLTIPGVPQTTGEFERFYGDVLPSAFIDDVGPSSEKYLYVLYSFSGSPTSKSDSRIHIARANLSARGANQIPPRLRFEKWYQGGWNAPGIQTKLASIQDDGIEPAGCGGGASYNGNAQLTYNEALERYMLTYVCRRLDCSTKPCKRTNLSWYFRTTRDLSTEDWSAPQLIENSTYADTYKTDKNGTLHTSEDGGYPTFMTPGCAPGHIGLTGYAFLLNGDPLGARVYARRKFTIDPGDTPVREACGSGIPRE